MSRWPFVFFVLLLGLVLSSPTHAATAVDGITISGGDLPHSVRLTAADEDAFKRRISEPPKLDKQPARATGTSYTLTSAYWNEVLERPGRPAASDSAVYYPAGGVVLAKVGEQDAWLALDLRQLAILDRYIRLTRSGALLQRPSVVDVLVGAQREEDVTVEGFGGFLTPGQVGSLWAALATTGVAHFLDTPELPKDESQGFWLIFGLQEGRSLQLFFDRGASPGTLTESMGSERYAVSPALAAVFATIQPTARPLGDVKSPGSKAWWVIMVGGGLGCLAAALWLSRHPLTLPFVSKS